MSSAFNMMPKCDHCGQFMHCVPGSSFAMRYSGHPPTPDHEQTRCVKCTTAHGPLTASAGIAAWTAGTVPAVSGSPQENADG